jgi:hypothetical protein
MLAMTILLLTGRAWADESGAAQPAPSAPGKPIEAAKKEPRTERAKKVGPTGRKAAAKPAPAKPAAAKPAAAVPAARDKAAPGKVVTLDAAAVSGEQQRPKASYVLQPNVKAVREAANSITEEHVESAARR